MKTTPLQIYSKSKVTVTNNGENKTIDYRYPVGLKWSCKRCGLCCQNVENHERHILLLNSDLKRFESGSYNILEISESSNEEEPFKHEMKKENGKCILLTEQGCKAYDYRALLCRMYPFYIEKKDKLFIIRFDSECKGLGIGDKLSEEFFQNLITFAINERGGI